MQEAGCRLVREPSTYQKSICQHAMATGGSTREADGSSCEVPPTDVDATVYQLNADGAERVMFFLRVGDQALRLLDREQREIHSTANYTLTLTTAASSR